MSLSDKILKTILPADTKSLVRAKSASSTQYRLKYASVLFLNGFVKDICELIKDSYARNIRIFQNNIPLSVRAAEISAEGISIFKHDPKGKVSEAYKCLAKEVSENGK